MFLSQLVRQNKGTAELTMGCHKDLLNHTLKNNKMLKVKVKGKVVPSL
jgi:hypothetical protein